MEAAALAALLGLEVHSVVGLAPCSPPAPGGAWGLPWYAEFVHTA